MSRCVCIKVDRAADWMPYKDRCDKIRQRVQPGTKVLLDDVTPLTTMNEFTLARADIARRLGRSWENTQNSYADDLYQYKTFLQAIGVEEPDVTREVLVAYAACFTGGVSVRTRGKFAPSTVHRRFGTTVRYHRFRNRKGLRSSVTETELSSLGRWERDGTRYKDPNSLYAKLPQDLAADDKIHPINDDDRRRIFDCLGPPANSEIKGASRRDRLAAETAVLTGMRIDEICSLTTIQILNLARQVDPTRPSKLIELRLTETKGLKPGTVYLPSYLVKLLLEYIRTERQNAIDHAAAVRYPTGSSHYCEYLFVNGLTANNRDVGNRLTTDTLSRAFSSACTAAGIVTYVNLYVLDLEGRPLKDERDRNVLERVQKNAHTFHD